MFNLLGPNYLKIPVPKHTQISIFAKFKAWNLFDDFSIHKIKIYIPIQNEIFGNLGPLCITNIYLNVIFALKGLGTLVIPIWQSSTSGICSPSTGSKLNVCSKPERNKNSSILAKFEPKHSLFPTPKYTKAGWDLKTTFPESGSTSKNRSGLNSLGFGK